MRSGHDRTRNRGLETLLSINELVFQDGPVEADHIKRKTSVAAQAVVTRPIMHVTHQSGKDREILSL